MLKEQKLQLNDLDLLILEDPVKACLLNDNAVGSCEFAIKEYYQYDTVLVLRPLSSLENALTIVVTTTNYGCISEKTTHITKKDMIGVYSYYLYFIGKL